MKAITDAGCKIYYSDTDSIITDCDLTNPKYVDIQ